MWPFNNILEELGGVEGSKSYINVKLWRSCIRLMKAFLNTTNVYGFTSRFVKCECVRMSRIYGVRQMFVLSQCTQCRDVGMWGASHIYYNYIFNV